jgi:dTDP-4-dehydrorhamnose reductase
MKVFPKLLIIGSNGLLGSNIVKILKKKKYKFKTLARDKATYNLDLHNIKKFKDIFKLENFNYVINCAAITDLKYCEKNFKEAKKINSDIPKILTNLSVKHKFKYIHISTDQVYYGKKNNKNKETDKIFTLNNYSKTKRLGETYALRSKKNLVLRTNFTGRHNFKKKTFSNWIFNAIKHKKRIIVYNDIFSSTLDVETCAKIILKITFSNASGVYNLGTCDAVSKKYFIINFAKFLKKRIIYISENYDDSLLKKAKNLGLDNSKIEKKLKIKMINSNKSIHNMVKSYL